MEEKREELYQKLTQLKSQLLDDQEMEQRIKCYNPKKIAGYTQAINSKKFKIEILQREINELDAKIWEEPVVDKEEKVIDPLAALFAIFEEGIAVLQSNRTFLHYILGRHPHAVLATLIQESAVLAKKIHTNDPNLSSLLHRYIQEAENPWNRDLYKGGFISYYRELKNTHPSSK